MGGNVSKSLTLTELTEPREVIYGRLAMFVSLIAWGACVVMIVPIMFALAAGILLWLGNGLLIARLKADAVKVEGDQLPVLAATFARVCANLEIETVPELFVLQSNGLLNAFATRHGGRNFVVVYSELLDTYGPDSPEIEFLLGHELGHIKRSHISKHLFLLPGLLFPLLGSAYSRACESSCDRHGLFAATDRKGAVNAMMVLAGGKQVKATMDSAAFASQYTNYRGFFVSWYELISGYPTTSQRVANLLAVSEGRTPVRARRNLLSYLFAFFTLGGRSSGGSNVFVTVAMVGLLAAIAIPSFARARDVSQTNACINNMRKIDEAKEADQMFYRPRGRTNSETGMPDDVRELVSHLVCPRGGTYQANPFGEEPSCSIHGTITEAKLHLQTYTTHTQRQN